MNKQNRRELYLPFTNKNFAILLNKYKYKLNIGDITAGTIFSREKQGFLVDIGESIVAYLPADEVSLKENHPTKPIINNSREFFILAYSTKLKQLIVSIKRLEYIRGWQRIKQIQKEDITNEFYIENINKGGLITHLEGIKSFIPNSHITNLALKRSYLHKKLKCQIFFIDEKTNTIILSNKRASLKELLSKIHVGKIIKGQIIQIQNYGIFINIHGFTALLHISEIGQDNLNNIKLFYIGNIICVKIIHIDKKQGRLSVSRRYLF